MRRQYEKRGSSAYDKNDKCYAKAKAPTQQGAPRAIRLHRLPKIVDGKLVRHFHGQ